MIPDDVLASLRESAKAGRAAVVPPEVLAALLASHDRTAGWLDRVGVFRLLGERCRAAGGQAAWARKAGLSQATVSEALNAKRDEFGPAVLGALELRRVVRYAPVAKPAATAEAADASEAA